MSFEVITTVRFDKGLKVLSKKYRSIKTDFKFLKESLEDNPFQGDELCPGVRKIRMAFASKGKGKYGGARVITYTIFVSEYDGEIYLIDIYDKSDYSTVDVNIIQRIIKDLDLTEH